MTEEEHAGWHPSDDPRSLAFDERERRRTRKNPGELASVESQYEKLILKGMARCLWAYAYGVWAQQDMAERDPDMADSVAGGSPIGFTIATWIDNAPPTPRAATRAARDLSNAIGNSEEVAGEQAPMSTLFALAMEIDTGEPYEFVQSKNVAPKIMRPDTILLFDCGGGGCAPRRFAEEMDRSAVTGVSDDDWATMEAGDTVDNEWIWDTWDSVEQSAVITDHKTGVKYTLATNDGVTFLIPEGMEWDDDEEWFVWPEEEDWVPAPTAFGRALAHMALRDGISWFDYHKQENKGMKWEPAIAKFDVAYVEHDAGPQLSWMSPHMEEPKFESTERRVRITFESVTPGPEDDDEPDVENGWEDEEGVVIDHDEDESIAELTVRLIGGGNNMLSGRMPGIEPSSSTFNTGIWYTQTDGSTDYQTGEVRTLSYHLSGYTADE
jgi:hypothetical protein